MNFLYKFVFILFVVCSHLQADQLDTLTSLMTEQFECCDGCKKGGNFVEAGVERSEELVSKNIVKYVKYYANTFFTTQINGYNFHVADYYGVYGNSRIITCLDGPLVGYQAIADNGVIVVETTSVIYYGDRSVHFYPSAKVTTSPYVQYIQFL